MENNKILRFAGLAIVCIFTAIITINSIGLVPQIEYLGISMPYYLFLISIDIIAMSIALILSFKDKKAGAFVGMGYSIVGMFTAGVHFANIALLIGYGLIA